MADDLQLWERTRSGDAGAFGDLYERHARAVQSYCLWRTADLQAAEDATATVFLEAWRKRKRQRLTLSTDSAAPLLLGIATNVVRRQWRSQRHYRDTLERVRNVGHLPTTSRPRRSRDSAGHLVKDYASKSFRGRREFTYMSRLSQLPTEPEALRLEIENRRGASLPVGPSPADSVRGGATVRPCWKFSGNRSPARPCAPPPSTPSLKFRASGSSAT
ncbi:MAG TPA: sigma factor [Solirubrobacterales bacterium]|nr:sigma factor [Solirubrobacterales bacterium]